MLRRVSPIVLLLLAGACTRVPSDVSSPEARDGSTPAAFGERASVEPIPSECSGTELTTCAASCSFADCLEWCAGESCAATIASLWSCMDEAEREFAAEHPAPEVEYTTETDEYGTSYSHPTFESSERLYEWEAAHDSMLDERWAGSCQKTCATGVASIDAEVAPFCLDWRSTYGSWAQLSEPAPVKDEKAGILGMAMSAGILGSMSFGTSVSLSGADQYHDDPYGYELVGVVHHAGEQLRGAENCVADLDANGREFMYTVEFDQNGRVSDTHLRDGESSAGACVAQQLADTFQLPIRVAREYSQFDVHVWVRPVPNWGTIDTGFGGTDDYDYDYGLGNPWGDESESGTGYGNVGSGQGGGGAGWGYGGGGAPDLVEPPPEPEDAED
jgi:hypothetical protein